MTLKPLTLAEASTLYMLHLALSHAADYSYRQQLHTHLEAHYGQLEHCRMVREINGEFDRAEREAGVSQVGWHGQKL
jgi:Spy/CpxP family protein refolding chaperone